MPQFAKGYRTYLVAAIGVALGVYQALIPYLHLPEIPTWALFLLGAAGLGGLRAGITTDTQKAVGDILGQVTTPAVPLAPSIAAASFGSTMTAKANGTPYAEFIKAGWTDAELLQNGYMTKSTS